MKNKKEEGCEENGSKTVGRYRGRLPPGVHSFIGECNKETAYTINIYTLNGKMQKNYTTKQPNTYRHSNQKQFQLRRHE